MCSQSRDPLFWKRAIRFAFWVLYNPLAWMYDSVSRAVSLGQWREWQRAGLAKVRGKRVLDLATGTGNTLLDLGAAQREAIGIDLSPEMLRIAKHKLERHSESVPLVRGRAQELPFASCSVDSVLSTFPAEYITASETLTEIARVLRPGGRAVIVAMAQLVPSGWWERLLEWLYRVTALGSVADVEPLIDAAGLQYSTEWHTAGGASVMLVLLEKPIDA